MPVSEQSLYEVMSRVHDPELFVNVVDLGLIYEVRVEPVDGKSNVHVLMTMTSPACPYAPQLLEEVHNALLTLDGVGEVEVTLTLNPPWTPDRLTEAARDELGIF